LDAHVVLFLEDLDRNALKGDQLGQVHALLDRLHREVKHVSFVLATSYESREQIDWLKLCERHEPFPRLHAAMVWPVLDAFVEHCLQAFPQDIYPQSSRRESAKPHHHSLFDKSRRLSFVLADGERRDWGNPLRLLTTPRRLKSTLRATWQAWKKLHGEIDFYDLLAVSALRTATPEAYEFLLRSMDEIRAIKEQVNDKTSVEIRDRLKKRWTGITKQTASVDRNDAWKLICAMFPDIQTRSAATIASTGKQQCLRETWPDFWRRLNTESVDGTPDQTILREIVAYKANPGTSTLLEMIDQNALLAGRFETFAGGGFSPAVTLTAAEIRQLASRCNALVLERSGSAANFDQSHALIPLWRLAMRRDIKNPRKWLWFEIQKALPTSLRFAFDLYYWWTARADGTEWASPQVQRRVRRAMVCWTKRRWSAKDPQSFSDSLDATFPWILHHFVRHAIKEGAAVFSPQDWQWLVPVLFTAADSKPVIMMPFVAALICRSEHGLRHERTEDGLDTQPFAVYDLDMPFIDAMFGTGENCRQLMRLLAEPRAYPQLKPQEQQAVEAIARAARSWLDQKPSEHSAQP
jgi:hypothetical protein